MNPRFRFAGPKPLLLYAYLSESVVCLPPYFLFCVNSPGQLTGDSPTLEGDREAFGRSARLPVCGTGRMRQEGEKSADANCTERNSVSGGESDVI